MERIEFPYYQYQLDGIEKMVHALTVQMVRLKSSETGLYREDFLRAFLLLDEMGCGKTVQVLKTLSSIDRVLPTLVVAPSACAHVWTEYHQFFPEFVFHTVDTLETPLNIGKNDVVIISYSALRHAFSSYLANSVSLGKLDTTERKKVEKIFGKAVKTDLQKICDKTKYRNISKYELYEQLMKHEWGVMIMDEVHRVKSATSLTTRAVSFINRRYSLATSGTPIMNNAQELLTIFKHALQLYDLEDPLKILDKVMLGRKKAEIPELQQILPVKKSVDVFLDWTDPDAKLVYRAIKRETLSAIKEYEEDVKKRMHVFQKIQALRQACLWTRPLKKSYQWSPYVHSSFPDWIKTPVFNTLLTLSRVAPALYKNYELRLLLCAAVANAEQTTPVPSPKMWFVYERINEMALGEKLVCVCSYKSFLADVMSPYLQSKGIQHLIFCGGSKKRQTHVLQQFDDDPTIRVLLMVKSAGALGLNLQKAANICIVMDPHYNQALDDQATQRVDRIGQSLNRTVKIYKLFMRGSIDEAILSMQQNKQRDIDAWLYKKDAPKTMQIYSLFLKDKDTV